MTLDVRGTGLRHMGPRGHLEPPLAVRGVQIAHLLDPALLDEVLVAQVCDDG